MRRLSKVCIGGFAVLWVVALISPAGAAAGSISGTVTDEGTDAGIAGIEVCVGIFPTYDTACAKTGAGGTYLVDGLPAESYQVRFTAWSRELNYVREWYGGDQIYPGDLVTVGATEARTGIDAELEPGGVITGTATDATTDGPAGGVWVWIDATSPVFYGIGFRAEADGKFEANDLPTGEYRVRFHGENDANYLSRYYDESETFSGATTIPVAAGSTVSDVDIRLYPGAQIFGRVTDVDTGEALYGVRVCAREVSSSTARRCDRTEADGSYAIRSLPAASYFVEFGSEAGPFGYSVAQWWNQASQVEDADPVTISPPESASEIDGAVPWYFGEELPQPETGVGGGTEGTEVVVIPPSPFTSPGVKPKPRKCKKGFHRKLVKGKRRCVRKHKHRKHQQRRKGGRAGKARG